MIEERYKKNLGSFFNETNQDKISKSTIAVIGIGGNGGYIIEMLARLGVKKIIYYDGDKYEISNLNRQIFCTKDTIGQYKVDVAFNNLKKINPNIEIESYPNYFENNQAEILIKKNPDVIIRSADPFINSYDLNKGLKSCLKAGIPVIDSYLFEHGTRINIHFPTDLNLFNKISEDQNNLNKNDIEEISQPAFLCAMSATFAVNEMTKLLNMENLPKFSYQLVFDLFENKMHLISSGKVIY